MKLKRFTTIFPILVLSLVSSVDAGTFRVLHYNIKELDTAKIEKVDPQFAMALEIIREIPHDFLSLNEVQYDLLNVPNGKFKTSGKNDDKILKLLGLEGWNSTFNQANTGNKARKKKNGYYVASMNDPESRTLADQVNFGIYPGQYSTMGLTKAKIIAEKVITNITWKEFNPAIKPDEHTGGDGKPLQQDMQLFDKNFTDITINFEGKIVHVILLHTVPSYHFGNPKSPNFIRNRDQLRFLEWYLTGKTDIEVSLADIRPLDSKDRWIAMGDFNVGLEAQAPGAAVLQSLKEKSNIWMEDPGHTNESPGFGPNQGKLQLDYIFTSKNIKVVGGHVYGQDPAWEDLGCDRRDQDSPPEGRKVISYRSEGGKQCYAMVSEKYFKAKIGSDHFPIYGEFRL